MEIHSHSDEVSTAAVKRNAEAVKKRRAEADLPSHALDDIDAIQQLSLQLCTLIGAQKGFLEQPSRNPY